jgi:hypothetical protein
MIGKFVAARVKRLLKDSGGPQCTPSLERIQEKAQRNYWTFFKTTKVKLNGSFGR